MPWKEKSAMDQRREFVALAMQEGANRRELCRRFGVSPPTAYKWMERAAAGGSEWPADLSRRPHHSPGRTSAAIEALVLKVRDAHPAWGARKIVRCLERQSIDPPADSTVHAILQRHRRILEKNRKGEATGRFEYPAPNLLWQMDFKGYKPLANGKNCHPLTVVDDHSRYALCLSACANQQGATVQTHLTSAFRRYGLPEALLVDNGAPWGNGPRQPWTRFGVWLLKLGVDVIHSRPYHPQTRGKNERFHRTLEEEIFAFNKLRDLDHAQRTFDRWRTIYNTVRPHQALGLEVPLSRYVPSPRRMPERTPAPEYASSDVVRSVGTTKGYISFKGRLWKVPDAFMGERVAIRPIDPDGVCGIFFAARQIAIIDLQSKSDV
jgi:transposase InsO family protein